MSQSGLWQRFRGAMSRDGKPLGLTWRSNTFFILTTIGMGMFSDLFLFALVIPILPFLLQDRVGLPYDQVQSSTSILLATFAAASVLLCPIAGVVSDKMNSRQIPFLAGLVSLTLSTLLFFLGTTMPALIIARLFQGASSAFVYTVGMTLAYDTVGQANLGKTIGSLFSVATAGQLFAPVVGGTLYRQSGIYAVLAVSLAVLSIDFVLRLLVIEKKIAARYISLQPESEPDPDPARTQERRTFSNVPSNSTAGDPESGVSSSQAETTPLLPGELQKQIDETSESYIIRPGQSALIKAAPILYPMLNSASLAASNLIVFTEALLISAYNATVPTQAYELYSMDSQQVSFLFIPLSLLYLVFGFLGGWATDRYGTKLGAVVGYSLLVPVFISLRLPQAEPFLSQVILWSALLGLIGVGTAIGASPGAVEAEVVVSRYHTANPEFFGSNGPYAQLYGLITMSFNLGLVVGPIVGGDLKDRIGYGNMNAVLAGIAGFTASVCLIWLGDPPTWWNAKKAK